MGKAGVQAHRGRRGEAREAHEGVAACAHISQQGLQVSSQLLHGVVVYVRHVH